MKASKCPLCGRRHWWTQPCPMGISSSKPVTKVMKVMKVVTKMGRPLLGSKPMSGAERMRRYRNRHKNKSIT